jgi:hypothetical protein
MPFPEDMPVRPLCGSNGLHRMRHDANKRHASAPGLSPAMVLQAAIVWNQDRVQRVELRILCVLQQGLQEPLMDGALTSRAPCRSSVLALQCGRRLFFLDYSGHPRQKQKAPAA